MKEYIDLCKRVMETGEWIKNERTGKKCLTVINADFTYDVSEGKLPILTTKKSFWKPAIAEMLGYLRGYTNAVDFRAIGCNTWNANANDNAAWLANPYRQGEDDMGNAYQFRSSGYFIESITIKKQPPKKIKNVKINNKLINDYTSNKHNLIGITKPTNNSGEFIIISEYPTSKTNKELVYTIQFIETGAIKDNVSRGDINRGEIKDIYHPSCAGIGYIGDITIYDKELIDMLKPVWRNMIGRCYETSNDRTVWYKDEGIFVDSRWLNFANFIEDFKLLPNWELKYVFPAEYSLDKDFYNANYYSSETCRWSSKKEQSVNSRNNNTFKAINLNTNEIVYAKGANDFGKKYNLPKNFTATIIGKCDIGETFIYHDWEITKMSPDMVTYIEVDQLKIIYAKLKLGIDDRRLIMTATHPHNKERECLPACMHTHTFSILNGELYLTSYQRSDDLPLGHGFNQIQVAWLLMIMAQITGLKPAKAYHKIVNAHIYEDQITLMKEVQINRKPLPSPILKINPDIKSLKDLETWVTLDDFELENYQFYPAIKYPFSV